MLLDSTGDRCLARAIDFQICVRGSGPVGLLPFTPHRFRDIIVSKAYWRKLPVDELKAWSQNIGHEGMLTTLTSYGKIPLEEQGRSIREKMSNPAIDIKQQLKALINDL